VQSARLVKKVAPVYPPLAKQAGIEGVVHLDVIIARDGAVEDVRSLGGPALLIQSATEAVKQWAYGVTLLNGEPVKVSTTVDVTFTLPQ